METKTPSSVYGPVKSWRLGRSLGIDILCTDSICSFECVYCQLGKINVVTSERAVFVTTEKIMSDLDASDWRNADVVTYSGSGEPTLALNLGESIVAVKEKTGLPVIVLTNSTLLDQESVRNELLLADRVFCKLDAWNEDDLSRIDRPAPGISLSGIIEGIRALREVHPGVIAIQTMLLKEYSDEELSEYSKIVREIAPDEIQLNVPSRAVPVDYVTASRGNAELIDIETRRLSVLPREKLLHAAELIGSLSGISVVVK
ncbi:MAG: radical SAM protein [Pyrinomonadaceae bacterium]